MLTHPTTLRWSTSLRLRRKEVGKSFCPLSRLQKRGQVERLSENRVSQEANGWRRLLIPDYAALVDPLLRYATKSRF